jgi:ribosome biogenesis GTPase A
MTDYELFLAIGRKRGFLVSGGEVSEERTANMLLDEFRAAKIGRITLDRVEKPVKGEQNA